MTILQMSTPLERSPTLSVVLPNYNHARYLESTLVAHLNIEQPTNRKNQ
jgi:hypothetical protein